MKTEPLNNDAYKTAIDALNHTIACISTVFCSRCGNDVGKALPINNMAKKGHHDGCGLQLIGRKKFSEEKVSNFIENTMHGLFHGFCVFFIASLSKRKLPSFDTKEWREKENYSVELLVITCLFHDFYRTVGDVENHDANLKEFFPLLEPTVFNHINPNKEQEAHPLIIGDRFEHYRYSKEIHETWIKPEMLEEHFPSGKLGAAHVFYRILRPALLKIYERRNEYWLRHDVDKGGTDAVSKQMFSGPLYPEPNLCWTSSGLNSSGEKKPLTPNQKAKLKNQKRHKAQNYAIEVTKGPWGHCITNHGDNWQRFYGLMPVKDYQGELLIRKQRDHLFAGVAQPYKQWTFSAKDTLPGYGLLPKVLRKEVPFIPSKTGQMFLQMMDNVAAKTYCLLVNHRAPT